jgi:hypothetical protein
MRNSAILWWRVLMIAGGFAFGLLGDRRPFGESFLSHPIVVFAALAGIALVILRILLQRPVPEVISERALVVGFIFGIAAFLAGNWISVNLLAVR